MLLQREKKIFEFVVSQIFLKAVLIGLLVLFVLTGYSLSAEDGTGESLLFLIDKEKARDVLLVAEANLSTVGYDAVDHVCGLIYQGDFEAAGKFIEESKKDLSDEAEGSRIERLAGVIGEFRDIHERRQSAREAAYRKRLKKLEKFRSKACAADINEVKDANNITSILSVIAQASKLADNDQKSELLSMPFVIETLDKTKAKAAEYDKQGKWLEAYTECHLWLKDIDEDNKQYSDYAEQLLDKANIEASFHDSPCETTKERYKGVKERMFKRAVEALNFNYVSINIGYRQMIIKGIERCKLLADVARLSSPEDLDEGGNNGCLPSDHKKLAAWSAAMDGLLGEVNAMQTGMSKDKFLDFFDKVLELNKAIAEFPETILIAQLAEAALSALDPYTVMIWPKQKEDFEKLMTNEFTGIGIEISRQKGWLTVASLLPDTPAYKSGLDAGDVIEAVNGETTKGMSLTCAVHRITGPPGTDVTLTVKGPGDTESRDIVIIRGKITVPTIRGWERTKTGEWLYMLDETNKIGYVRITSFSDRTADDLEKVLDKLESDGLQGLILDLRYNTGGLLNSAIDVTDKFVSKGLIVSTRPRFGVWTYASARSKNTHPNYPLAVLINRFSASASEIVAGSLQDPMHKRAILVGDRTHGKGSVQGITSYPEEGAQLKYTMAYYHLPSGKKVESPEVVKKEGRKDWGVGPDIKLRLTIDELKKMLDVQRDNDILARADHQSNGASLRRHNVEDTLASDAQLAVGLLVVKSKLVQAGALIQN